MTATQRRTAIGTTIRYIALIALGLLYAMPFGWMIWTCAAGCGLGLLGLEYCRRRKRARALRDEQV